MEVKTHFIFLNGMMGVGKSSIGLRAALNLNLPFIDLDAEIVTRKNKSISTLFKESGETGFRKIESRVLRELKNTNAEFVIVSTGGGTPAFHGNMEYMNTAGTTILLHSPVEDIIQRLKRDHTDRPILQSKNGYSFEENLKILYSKREVYYKQSKHILQNIGSENEVINILTDLIKNIIQEKQNQNK